MKFFDSFWGHIEKLCLNQLPRIIEGSLALLLTLLALNISFEHVEFYSHAGYLARVPVEYSAGILFATSAAQFVSLLLPPALLSRRLRKTMLWLATAEWGIVAISLSRLVLWGWTVAIPMSLIMTAAVIRLRVKQDGSTESNANDYHGGIRAAYNAGGASASLPVSESETPQRRRDSSQHRAFGS